MVVKYFFCLKISRTFTKFVLPENTPTQYVQYNCTVSSVLKETSIWGRIWCKRNIFLMKLLLLLQRFYTKIVQCTECQNRPWPLLKIIFTPVYCMYSIVYPVFSIWGRILCKRNIFLMRLLLQRFFLEAKMEAAGGGDQGN